MFKFFLDKVNNNSNNNNNNNNSQQQELKRPIIEYIARNQISSFFPPKVAIKRKKY